MNRLSLVVPKRMMRTVSICRYQTCGVPSLFVTTKHVTSILFVVQTFGAPTLFVAAKHLAHRLPFVAAKHIERTVGIFPCAS